VEKQARNLFEKYGYRELRAPVFEATELFERGTGTSSDIVLKEMYTFTDKGGRSLTLRPEYTPSVVRAIIEHRLYLQPHPLRFYYIGPMFRYDKPQKGRYRQFHQMDIEVFAEKDPGVDAEIIQMAQALLEKVGVTDYTILVNSVGCPHCRPSYVEKLRQAAEQVKAELCPDCRRRIELNPLRLFDCKVETCRALAQDFPKITDHLCADCAAHFHRFQDYLGVFEITYQVEPRLVRGLDYYTKTTFEFVTASLGAQDAILGGGRYDEMMKLFGGPDLCGIGFAVGMERLLSLVSYQPPEAPFVFIIYMGEKGKREAMKLVASLRKEGVECWLEYKERSLRNQLSRANKLSATWTLIIGEDEVKTGRFNLKDMVSGQQRSYTPAELIAYFRNFSQSKKPSP
jgi:histidyl-tRNA synthetase